MSRLPKPDRRSALELLAANRDSCTESMMIARGVILDDMGQAGAEVARGYGLQGRE
jgi:hypothetical protein